MSPQQILSTNTFTTARWIVSSDATQGSHTTIAGALTSASSGDTIFIRPGTYTENLTLKVGVNLTAYTCDSVTPNVTIIGNATLSTAGTVSISGIRLQTNSAALITVSGSVASILNLNDCYLNCTNNTGITFSSSSASAAINLVNCGGDLGTTGIAYFTSTSAGILTILQGHYLNSGNSITSSSTSSAAVQLTNCLFVNALSTTSTGSFVLKYSEILSGAATTLTTAGTGVSDIIWCILAANSGNVILSIGAGTTVNVTGLVSNTTANPAIIGAGTINYNDLMTTGNVLGITTTTQSRLGQTLSINIVPITATGANTYTPSAGMVYCIVEAQGGGGGGGGTTTSAAGNISTAGGGGAGGYTRGFFSKATIGTSQTVTINTGGGGGAVGGGTGTTGGSVTFGALLTANGGVGGGGSGTGTTNATAGGAGGTASGGTVNITGGHGQAGYGIATIANGGAGANSRFGDGGTVNPAVGAGTVAGTAATGFGAGGGGSVNLAGAQNTGGAGTTGIVIVTEYIIS